MKDTVYIYQTNPAAIGIGQVGWLDETEQAKALAFKFAQDRHLYIAAHIFLRQTLSRHADVPPANWRFVSNAYGKPTIANPAHTNIQFNLSHTQGLIACAISNHRTVGIDVERCKPLSDLESLTHHAFSPQECQDVLSMNGVQREQHFFTYWTLKEAYIKARGMGLTIPLQQFTFTQAVNGQWQLYCEPELQDSGENWHFLSLPIENSHYLALAIQAKDGQKFCVAHTTLQENPGP